MIKERSDDLWEEHYNRRIGNMKKGYHSVPWEPYRLVGKTDLVINTTDLVLNTMRECLDDRVSMGGWLQRGGGYHSVPWEPYRLVGKTDLVINTTDLVLNTMRECLDDMVIDYVIYPTCPCGDAGGFKSRIRPPYPQRVVKGD